MAEILQTLASLSVLVFVVSSMLAMGLSLTIAQIVGALLMPVVLMLVGGELGKRVERISG